MFQKRFDGSQSFDLTWDEYKQGFGNLNGEFWLGNDFLHNFTQQDTYELRIELSAFNGSTGYIVYDSLKIGNEDIWYQLQIGNVVEGTLVDDLAFMNGYYFSCKDKLLVANNTYPCAYYYPAGWWTKSCFTANLNGLYHPSPGTIAASGKGVIWLHFTGNYYSLKSTEMKLRPASF